MENQCRPQKGKHKYEKHYSIADLSLTNKNLKNEKSSLLTAFQLIQTDYNQLTMNANALGIEKSCQVVNEHKTLYKTKKSPRNFNAFTHNPNAMTSDYSDKGDIPMSNQYEVLSDSDENIDNESTNKLNPPKQGHKESKKSYARAATPKNSNDRNPTQKHTTDIPSRSSRLKNKNRNEDDNNNPVTIIVGDSMIKGLRPDKISKSVKHKTQIKSVPGTTVEDLDDYIKPSLKRKPKNIILHVGTNDLKRKSAKDIATNIDKLCKSIKSDHPQMSISVSEIIHREDNQELMKKVMAVNKELFRYSEQKKFYLIRNENIDKKKLNVYGLHLNRFNSISQKHY